MIVYNWNGRTVKYTHENCHACAPYTSLEKWREYLCCLAPHMFWQLSADDCELCGMCEKVVREDRAFPEAHLGRNQIRRAILRAEIELHKRLGYPVVPTWINRVVDVTPCGTFYLPEKHVQKLGRHNRQKVGEFDVTLFAEYYGDCIDEFEIKFTINPDDFDHQLYRLLSYAEPDALKVYFAESDIPRKLRDEPHQRWQVEPIEVDTDGYNVLITGRAWTIVKPEMHQFANMVDIPADNADSYVAKLEVWHESIDECDGVLAMTRNDNHGCGCKRWDCTSCYRATPIRACLEDKERGIGRIDYEQSCACDWGSVDKLCVSYLAGDCTRDWTPEIVALSTAYLKADLCDCHISCLTEYTEDLSMSASDKEERRMVTLNQLENPLGTLVGHKIAWEAIQQYKCRDNVFVM